MAQLKLSSIAAIQKWADNSQFERIDGWIAVFKNGVWNYFGKMKDGYVLQMTSLELLGESK